MGIKIVTGKSRLSHVHVFEKFAFGDNAPAFSVMVMVPKSDTKTIKAIRTAEKEAAEEGKAKFKGGKIPKELNSIWKDGDDAADEYPEQEGHIFAWVTKKGNGKDISPPVLDVDGTEMLDPQDIYSGCYARVSMEAFAYSGQKQGVTFGLRAIKKVADGERLGPVDSASDDFEDDDDEALI